MGNYRRTDCKELDLTFANFCMKRTAKAVTSDSLDRQDSNHSILKYQRNYSKEQNKDPHLNFYKM